MDAIRGLEWLARREPNVMERTDVSRVMRGEATVRASDQEAQQEGDVRAHGPGELTGSMRAKTKLMETWEVVEDLLQTHELTEKVCTCFRPAILRMVTRIVERRRLAGKPWKERMVLLCSAVLPLAPHTEETFVEYFRNAPSPLARFAQESPGVQLEGGVEDSEIVKSFHIIITNSHALCSFWGASPLWTLLDRNGEICWNAIQALSIKYGLVASAQRTLEGCFMSQEDMFQCRLHWKEYLCRIQLERACMYLSPSYDASPSESDSAETTCPAPASIANICGVELSSQSIRNVGNPKQYVLTDSIKQNLHACAFALAEGRPLLLEGPPGAGKSMLINYLARSTANESIVTLHLDDKLDSKSLLGSYVCGTNPGEFCWQDGPLTQAVKKGLWLVLEDVDYASFELISALQTLLQERLLNIPSRGDVIEAAHGFQLFATMSNGPGSAARNPATRDYLISNFFAVEVKPLPVNEVEVVLRSLYPELVEVVPRMLCALAQLNMAAVGKPTEVICDDSQARHWIDTMKDQAMLFSTAMGTGFRGVSMRELSCWCSRVLEFHSQHLSLVRAGLTVPSSVREKITMEGIDVLIGAISRESVYVSCLEGLANSFALPREFIAQLADSWKPKLEVGKDHVQVGRARLTRSSTEDGITYSGRYIHTGHALRLMERVSVAVQLNEPVLLVGETGTGKTALVQHLASVCGEKLVVINMSQQTDSSDFLGGFRPLGIEETVRPLLKQFQVLFRNSFSPVQNMPFLQRVQKYASKKRWAALLKAFIAAGGKALSELSKDLDHPSAEPSAKRRKGNPSSSLEDWKAFYDLSKDAEHKLSQYSSGTTFAFVEGILVKALREGCWLLLDEINLAPAETLERIAGVLESPTGSLVLTERGDLSSIQRSPTFRLFACMNPGTDVGKKSLPPQLRSRFTEIPAPEPKSFEDMHMLVSGLLSGTIPEPPVTPVVNFYFKCKQEAGVTLLDSGDGKPQYSLRALYRALEYTRAASPTYGFGRALFDGFSMTFLTLLKSESVRTMEKFLQEILMCGKSVVGLNRAPASPGNGFVQFDSFWVQKGDYCADEPHLASFILTPTINTHLKNLARAVLLCKYPILLQGPTSSGKTSLVAYLAGATGHKLLRINNHEHTDLSEYIGTYTTTTMGGLQFQEGLLVQAMRKGYWIVLDELNLAPTEVLEALNRLLDDNRELFIPDTQETIKPHPHFMLFATQNPPGIYGGRKPLSQAFRSRFLEIHVDEIPDDELVIILEQRCLIPKTYARKMTEVQKDLQRHRRASLVFAGKHGLVTPRILFKWAERHSNGYSELAEDGVALLAERLRLVSERDYVKHAIEKVLRVKVDTNDMYTRGAANIIQKLDSSSSFASMPSRIVWTTSLQRLLCLVARCVSNGEHVLLVGETGCGKTTVCQLVAAALKKKLHTVNCHQHTEASDFVGGYRPVRTQESARKKLEELLLEMQSDADLGEYFRDFQAGDDTKKLLQELDKALERAQADGLVEQVHGSRHLLLEISEILGKGYAPFVWEDGPLVKAMQNGDFMLIDELSLAEDAVLERLNSVLEPDKKLMIAEKGGSACEVVGKNDFVIFATMNPGGDFGKRELSPALRNRFTEIWVPPLCSKDELWSIVHEQLVSDEPERSNIADAMLDFWMDFTTGPERSVIAASMSVRDLLSWSAFINATFPALDHWSAFVHGAHLAFIDGIGIGHLSSTERNREEAIALVGKNLPDDKKDELLEACCFQSASPPVVFDVTEGVKIGPFNLPLGDEKIEYPTRFDLAAPTVAKNALKVARALQVSKPILLEGSPGVGKTSLIAALARASGNGFVRINLSEQTDVMDLLGADLPAEGNQAGEFVWSDGPLLHALKNGHWVLLDELNLASQSVLEGLNALLDHREEVYIPELSTSFRPKEGFRVFGAQNPITEGGGRKGLPRSFLNRFTKVWCYPLQESDLTTICSTVFSCMPRAIVENMVKFNSHLHKAISVKKAFGSTGSPWEFNLRDVLRWCELLNEYCDNRQREPALLTCDEIYTVMSPLYMQRMRTQQDKEEIKQIFASIFNGMVKNKEEIPFHVEMGDLCIGSARLPIREGTCVDCQRKRSTAVLLPGDKEAYETAAHCLASNWLCLVVGPQGSGKTTFVRNLSLLSNNILHECNLTSGTDANDILGGFEQRDFERHVSDAEQAVHQYWLETICKVSLSITVENAQSTLSKLLQTSIAWEQYMLEGCRSNKLDVQGRLKSLMCIVDGVQACISSHGSKNQNLLKVARQIESLRAEAENCPFAHAAGAFEWVDGVVTRAMEEGHWVVLEGANLCSPAVLDRLNPVLESEGKLLINEAGIIDGKLRVIRPHPDFRLFLTIDPRYGEVSRAMRNRGVEVYLSAPLGTARTSRVEAMMSFSQIPGRCVKRALSTAYTSVCELLHEVHVAELSLTDMEQFLTLFLTLLYRGSNLRNSFSAAWSCTYLRRIPHYAVLPEKIEAIERDCVSKLISQVESSLFNCSDWPFLVSLGNFAQNPLMAIVEQDTALYTAVCTEFSSMHIHLPEAVQPEFISTKILFCLAADRLVKLPTTSIKKAMGFDVGSHPDLARMGDASFRTVELMQQFAGLLYVERAQLDDQATRLLYLMSFARDSSCPIFGSGTNSGRLVDVAKTVFGEKLVYGALQKRFLLIFLWRNAILREMEDGLRKGFLPTEPTLLERSCWLQITNTNTLHGSKSHACVEWIYPFILLLDQQIGHAMRDNFESSREVIERLLLWRNALVDSGSSSSPDIQKLALCFQKCMKAQSAINSLLVASNAKLCDRIEYVGKGLRFALGLGHMTSKPILWRDGGKPRLPSSPQMLKYQEQLFWMCEKFMAGSPHRASLHASGGLLESKTFPFRASYSLKKEACEGAALLEMHMYQPDSSIDFRKIVAFLQESLKETLEAKKEEGRDDVEGCAPVATILQNAKRIYKQTLPLYEADHPSWMEFQFLLSRIEETRSLSAEHEAIEKVLKCLLQSALSIPTEWKECIGLLEMFVHTSLAGSARSPYDYAPALLILWGMAEKEPSVAETLSQRGYFKEQVQRMLWTYHRARWHGLHGFESAHNLLEEGALAQSEIVCDRPVQLSIDGHTFTLLFFQDTTAGNLATRKMQLKHVFRCCTDGWMNRSTLAKLASERSIIVQLMIQIALEFLSTYEGSCLQELKVALRSLLHYTETSCGGETCVGTTITRLETILLTSSNAAFQELSSKLLVPAMRNLFPERGSDLTAARIGYSWTLLGLLRLHLVRPLSVVDPSYKATYTYDVLHESKEELENELRVRVMYESCPYKTCLDVCLPHVREAKEETAAECKRMERKLVARPEPSIYTQLKMEVDRFVEGIADIGRISYLAKDLVSTAELETHERQQKLNEVKAFQETSLSFLDESLSQYFPYADILQPVQLAVYELKSGLSYIVSSIERSEQSQTKKSAIRAARSLMSFPPSLGYDYTHVRTLCSLPIEEFAICGGENRAPGGSVARQTNLGRKMAALVASLRWVALSGRCRVGLHNMHIQLVESLLKEIHSLWRELKEHLEAEEQEASVIFKYKGLSINPLNESGNEEEELRKRFPDHHELFEDLAKEVPDLDDPGVTGSKSSTEDLLHRKSEKESLKAFFEGGCLSEVIRFHSLIFSQERSDTLHDNCLRVPSFEANYKVAMDILETSNEGNLDNFAPCLAGHLMKLCRDLKGYQVLPFEDASLMNSTESLPDFHHDSNPAEASLVKTPVSRLRGKIHSLLKEWPENAVLLELDLFCTRLLGIKLSLPLKSFSTGLELLISRTQIWEESAASYVSLRDEIVQLAALARRWRKLELHSWRQALEYTARRQIILSHESWLHLLGVINSVLDGDVEPIDVTSSLQEFVMASTVGQFKARIAYLTAFQDQIQRTHGHEVVGTGSRHRRELLHTSLSNIQNFFSQYESKVEEYICGHKEKIEKEMLEFIKLTRWEDRGYYALKESADKSSRTIHRLCRKFQDVLSLPFPCIVEEDKGATGIVNISCECSLPMEVAEPTTDEMGNAKAAPEGSKHWEVGAARLTETLLLETPCPVDAQDEMLFDYLPRVPALTKAMVRHFRDSFVAQEGPSSIAESLEILSSTLANQVYLLQKDQKATKQRKKKALTDFLHAFRDLGLSRRQMNYKCKNSLSWTLVPPIAECPFSDASSNVSPCKLDEYFYKSQAFVQQVFDLEDNASTDLSPEEIESGLSFADQLVHLQGVQRRGVSQHGKQLLLLRQCVGSISQLPMMTGTERSEQHCQEVEETCKDPIQEMYAAYTSVADFACLLHELIGLEDVTERKSAFEAVDFALQQVKAALRVFVDEWEQVQLQCLLQECTLPVFSHNLGKVHGVTHRLSKEFMRLKQVVEASKQKDVYVPGIDLLIARVEEIWLQLHPRSLLHKIVADMEKHSDLDSSQDEQLQSLNNCIRDALLWSQKAVRYLSHHGKEDDEAKKSSLPGTVEQLQSLLESHHLTSIMQRLKSLVVYAYGNHDFEPNKRSIRLQLQQSLPLFRTLLVSYETLFSEHLHLHKATAKLGYIALSCFVEVLKNGYCGPLEESTKAIDSGKTKEIAGTGVGEGKGAKDVSDEIENEDQVLGNNDIEDKVEEEDADNNEKDEAKGIEMEQDFAGELGDVSGGEEDEEDDQEEEEQLDKQLGDFDSGEDVDERMWGDDDKPDGSNPQEGDGGTVEEPKGDLDLRGAMDEEGVEEDNQDKSKNHENAMEESDHGEEEQSFSQETPRDHDDAPPNNFDIEAEEEFELPDDMALDGDQDGGDGDGEEDSPEGEEKDPDKGNPDEALTNDAVQEDSEEERKDTLQDDAGTFSDQEAGEEPCGEKDIEDEGDGDKNINEMDENLIATSQVPEEVQTCHQNRDDELPSTAGLPQSAMPENQAENSRPDGSFQPNQHSKLQDNQVQEESLLDQEDEKPDYHLEEDTDLTHGPTVGGKPNKEAEEADARAQKPQEERTNACRTLADALKEWVRRLAADGENDDEVGDPESLNGEGAEGMEYEFEQHEGEVGEGVQSAALAAATEEQHVEMQEGATDRVVDTAKDGDEPDAVNPKHLPSRWEEESQIDVQMETEREDFDGREDAGKKVEMHNSVGDGKNSHVSSLAKERYRVEGTEWTDAETEGKRTEAEAPTIPETHQPRQNAGVERWMRYEQLSSHISGELVEQLRLLLEPTVASKLGGEYKTGKRINMRKVISYIASKYKKDKIWMRRTKPDKRNYQVVMAIDDSMSMTQNHCAHFALESVALIATALSRLDVGELGIVSWGGGRGVELKHPLDQPFTQQCGIRMLEDGFCFDQDNTIADKPAGELLSFLDDLLQNARDRVDAGYSAQLQQLVLIIADGHFHEKESLQRKVRQMMENKGLLLAFIVLDSPSNSVMDMQSVSFEDGRPVFQKYMDSFPFPYYIVLTETASLPQTLADLLRQWFECCLG